MNDLNLINKKRILIVTILIGLLLTILIGFSAAYIAPIINGTETSSTLLFNSGSIDITYENGSSQINAVNILPGWTSVKEFSLTAKNNTSSKVGNALNYGLKLVVEENTFSDGAITYSINGSNPSNNGTLAYVLTNSLKSGKSIVSLGYGNFDNKENNNVKHNYTLTISFPNKTNSNQNENMGKRLSAYVIIEQAKELVDLTIVDEQNSINKTIKFEKNKEYELPTLYNIDSSNVMNWSVTSGNGTIQNNILNITGNVSIKSTNSMLYSYISPTSSTPEPYYTFTVPCNGNYKLETWGASSYSSGGYAAGNILLNENEKLYIYIGGVANDRNGGYNGGGNANSGSSNNGGSGATDIRYEQKTLYDRIMVAGAAGHGNASKIAAGGLSGYDTLNYQTYISKGGTQTEGGTAGDAGDKYGLGTSGKFGIGGNGGGSGEGGAGGGGGGYYGGGGGGASFGGQWAGGSGSSFISGHTGCVAIEKNNSTTPKKGTSNSECITGTTDNLCSIHYSGKEFTNTVMIDGKGYSWTNVKGELKQMPNPDGGYYDLGKGHSGNGFARITLIS